MRSPSACRRRTHRTGPARSAPKNTSHSEERRASDLCLSSLARRRYSTAYHSLDQIQTRTRTKRSAPPLPAEIRNSSFLRMTGVFGSLGAFLPHALCSSGEALPARLRFIGRAHSPRTQPRHVYVFSHRNYPASGSVARSSRGLARTESRRSSQLLEPRLASLRHAFHGAGLFCFHHVPISRFGSTFTGVGRVLLVHYPGWPATRR